MKVKPFILIAFVFLWLTHMSVCMAESVDAYRLRQGDGVLVSVWGEAALNKEVRVLPDGSITFPLAGRVEVANLTTPEVEKRITEKLKVFLPEPQVTVVVTSTEGTKAYILGKVLKPGPILITGPITVLQALSMAGGLDKFADLGAVKILRLKADNSQEVVPVHYDKLIQGQDLGSNVLLQSGDTIVVP
jgi:polysaccharide export outer membrane protein